MKRSLNAIDATFLELIGNGKVYKIPPFQRDYSWSKENWEDLWNDFLTTEETSSPHYMGSIVLQNDSDFKDDDEHFIVVDGQQRLTTMTIYAIATISTLEDLIKKEIDKENNQQRILEIERTFLGKKSIATLFYETKLSLNKNNNSYYQTCIVKRKEPISYHKLKDSEKALYDCFRFFKDRICEKFSSNGEEMTNFLENIVAKKMIFIRIKVDSEIEAYTIFETLNARGVELTTTDLLKNYLFLLCSKKIPDSDMDILEEKWNDLVHNIGLNDFPTFLRYYINSKQKLVRKENLFKTIKNLITTPENVLELLEDLEKKQLLYTALKSPEDDFWNSYVNKNSIIKSLRELKIFQSTQQIPFLFAVHDNLIEIFPKILHDISCLIFRYNIICKKNPNDLEIVYNNISQKIYNKEISNRKQILKELAKIYIEDADFKTNFSNLEIKSGGKNKKLIKYILTKIENQINNCDYDWNDGNSTIEHILPEKYDIEWNKIFENNAQKFIFRLGNYTLLENELNQECSNKNNDFKKNIYKKSKYKLANTILT
jgi:uncharacterized protein with ParB-like and HNH nuclease domain